LVINKYYYRGIYRRNEADKFIFLLPTDLPTEKKYRRKIHRRSISVGKLITDRICVLRRWKNSVGKTVKSCSDTWVIVHDLSWYCWIYLVKIFFYNIVGVLIVVLVCLYNFFLIYFCFSYAVHFIIFFEMLCFWIKKFWL
jgi:hypothetical protein